MQSRAWIALVAVLSAASTGTEGQTQAQTPPVSPGVTETVTVSAREAKIIADAIHALKGSGDPFIATTVADNILKLADAMEASSRIYQIGPLTEQEQTVIDLGSYLQKHAVAGGPIRLQGRRPDSTEGSRVYTFTRSSLITLFADIAATGFIQVRTTHETKIIVVTRMIEDLNEQQGLIPEREILSGILRGFKDEDKRGVITDRVLDIAEALAASAVVYPFVPNDQQKVFRSRAQMGDGDVFEKVPQLREGMVNLSYGGAIYTASVEHFVWFFIRFLLEDQRHSDWNVKGGIDLGGKILDYLTAQLQVDALNTVGKALDAAGTTGSNGIPLGDFRVRGPIVDVVKRAPGVVQRPSTLGSDYCVLVVPPEQAQKLPKLRRWLEERTWDLRAKIAGARD